LSTNEAIRMLGGIGMMGEYDIRFSKIELALPAYYLAIKFNMEMVLPRCLNIGKKLKPNDRNGFSLTFSNHS